MAKKFILLIAAVILLALFGCSKPEDGTYHILYQANASGTIGYPPIDSNLYKTGNVAVVLDKNTLSRTGYTFSGWNTKTDGSGDTYNPGDEITIEYSTIFLYAVWTPE